jgi:ATP-dependent Lon protease
MIPDENRKDLVEIPDNIKGKLDIRPVRWIDEVLEIALTARPVPRVQETAVVPPTPAPKRRARARTPRPPQAH